MASELTQQGRGSHIASVAVGVVHFSWIPRPGLPTPAREIASQSPPPTDQNKPTPPPFRSSSFRPTFLNYQQIQSLVPLWTLVIPVFFMLAEHPQCLPLLRTRSGRPAAIFWTLP